MQIGKKAPHFDRSNRSLMRPKIEITAKSGGGASNLNFIKYNHIIYY